jgi:hypothetical protein
MFTGLRDAVRGLDNPDESYRPHSLAGIARSPGSEGAAVQMTAAHWRALQPGHNGREGRAMSRGETLKSARRLSLSQVINSRLLV